MNRGKKALVLIILSIVAGMVYLTPLIRFTFYDQMVDALQITDVQLGTIGAIYGLFNVIGYLPSGFLAEKFNTKKLLIVSSLGMLAVTIWYSTYPGFIELCIIHALYGIFSVGTFWSPYLKTIRNLGPECEQGRLFGMSEGIRGIGQTAVASLCLGAMTLFPTVSAGFKATLIIQAVVFGLLALAVFIFVPDFDKKAADGQGKVQKRSVLRSIIPTLGNSSIWICIFLILCGYTLWATVNGYIGTYGTRVLGLTPELSSTLSIIRSYIIVFVAGFTGGFIIDKFKTKGKGMLFAFAGIGLSMLGVFLTSSVVFVCVAFTILLAYIVNVVKSTYWSILGEAGVPLASTGMATGVISLIALTPDIFATPIISQFLAYGEAMGDISIGFNLMIFWVIGWSILGIIAALILKKRAKKTKAPVESAN